MCILQSVVHFSSWMINHYILQFTSHYHTITNIYAPYLISLLLFYFCSVSDHLLSFSVFAHDVNTFIIILTVSFFSLAQTVVAQLQWASAQLCQAFMPTTPLDSLKAQKSIPITNISICFLIFKGIVYPKMKSLLCCSEPELSSIEWVWFLLQCWFWSLTDPVFPHSIHYHS